MAGRQRVDELQAARRAASRVGLITLPIGLVAVSAPHAVGRLLRLGEHPVAVRTIGAADLVLVPGLLAGRRRWPWLSARAGLNLVIAGYCLRLDHREGVTGARIGVAAMVVATAADGLTIRTLRRLEPQSPSGP